MAYKDVWIVSVKSRRLMGCVLDNGSEFYFVECLIPANSNDEAMETVELLLRDKRLKLSEVLRCEAYDSVRWKDTIQFRQIEKAAEHVRTKSEPQFALFISSKALVFDEESGDK